MDSRKWPLAVTMIKAAHLPVVGILATLSLDQRVLNYAERLGFLVLAVGDQVMEVKNRPGFEPKRR